MAPKQKAQKMALGDFLKDEGFGSWADEMDEMPLPPPDSRPTYDGQRRAFGTSSFEDRGFAREALPLPTAPPFTAHVGNLSFDSTSTDVEQLFADCDVVSVRVVEDRLTGAPKGFGYVEFKDVEGLKKALALSGSSLQNRPVRVSVAEPPKDREPARDFDWSRKGPLPDLPREQTRDFAPRRGKYETLDPAAGAGPSPREFSWERRGPLSPTSPPAGMGGFREGGRARNVEGPGFRRQSPAAAAAMWGEARSRDTSRPAVAPVDKTPTAAEMDNQWRARMKPDAPAPAPPSEPKTPISPSAPSGVRPKLNLQKRSVPATEAAAPASASTESKANPFGAARPIDTAAREREVEEKRVAALKAKKEAEEKAKEEQQKEAERKAKEAAEAVPVVEKKGAPTVTTDGQEVASGGKNWDILNKVSELEIKDEAGEEKPAEEKKEEEAPAAAPAAEALAEAPTAATTEEAKPAEEAAPATETPAATLNQQQPPQQPKPAAPAAAENWRTGRAPRGGSHRGRGGRGGRGGQRGDRHGRDQHHQNQEPREPREPRAPAQPVVDEDGWSTVGPAKKGKRGSRF
ncbi:hypothetical protein KEM55_002865 [Ascosphaera atra]|nr:hypothetical protein KEM55_002865 [Ascosphaera atra]